MTLHSNAAHRLQLSWHGRTAVGCVRTNNEDSLWAGALAENGESGLAHEAAAGEAGMQRPGILLAVADGMGGAKAGEVASGMAVRILAEELAHRVEEGLPANASVGELSALFVAAVELANERIRDEGHSNPNRKGMGTTLTAAWLFDNVALVVHVGDSRAYLFRKGNLTQITKDQSLVEKLLEDKIISEEEAERMAARNIILQALGSEEDLEVARPEQTVKAGDTLLLCTDGLTGVVNNTELEESMRRGGSLEDVCRRLIANAESKGGPDNITVLLGRIENEHAVR